MKIYKQPEPVTLMRVNIKKQGHKTEHIAIEDATQDQLIGWIQSIIERQKLSIFSKGNRITVEVREYTKGENGKMKSFSFYGLNPILVKDLIIKSMKTITL